MSEAVSTLGPAPVSEAQRQWALDELGILDTEPEERFDRVTRLAAEVFGVRSSAISFLHGERQWVKSSVGTARKDGPRSAFCNTVVQQHAALVVPDAREDPRFRDNPFVTGGPRLRFYAGHPLEAPGGEPVGTLCLYDPEPRTLTPGQARLLRELAGWVQDELSASEELDRAAEV